MHNRIPLASGSVNIKWYKTWGKMHYYFIVIYLKVHHSTSCHCALLDFSVMDLGTYHKQFDFLIVDRLGQGLGNRPLPK